MRNLRGGLALAIFASKWTCLKVVGLAATNAVADGAALQSNLLRWVVCAVCGYTAYWFSKIPLLVKYSFCLGFLAFLFNPILIVPFDTSLWILVYLGTAICLLTLAKKIS